VIVVGGPELVNVNPLADEAIKQRHIHKDAKLI
jgi:hypothetical protein